MATDGSKGGNIYCLKVGEVAAKVPEIAWPTKLENSRNPFSKLNDNDEKEELETNKLLANED